MSGSNSSGGPVLGAASLSKYVISSLAQDADPQLKTPTDAVAIACHAGMLAVGFSLIGLGEDHQIEAHSDTQSIRPLPSEWNASSSHAFRYKHAQSSMQFLLKVSRLGNKTVVYGIGVGDDKTTSFDLTTKDFISESALPASPVTASASAEDSSHAVQTIFISPSRLADLGSLLQINVIQKLVPSLQKEGYEETSSSTNTQDDRGPQRREPPLHPRAQFDPLRDDPLLPHPAQPHPLVDPSVGPRRPPVPTGEFQPPGFEDEYEMNAPPRGWHPGQPGMGGPPRIGDQDLYPPGMGPHDPLRMGPGRRGGGGMHPTFDDLNPYGDPDGLGDLRAPPGARYDPPGPGYAPRGSGMGGPFGGGGGGFGGGGFGGGGGII